jgi:hypothetical protein
LHRLYGLRDPNCRQDFADVQRVRQQLADVKKMMR